MTSSSTVSRDDLTASLDLIEIKPGKKFSLAVLQDLLPDTETALFFGKVYDLNYRQLSALLSKVLRSTIADALFGGVHSNTLQGYILAPGWLPPTVSEGFKIQFEDGTTAPTTPQGEILPYLWEQLEVEVAQSLKDVASKLENVVGLLPGKQGKMLFKTMQRMNLRRPTLGTHNAVIEHGRVMENLVILDDSGSVSAATVQKILADVIALSYKANAHLVLISNTARHWAPGAYSIDNVLATVENGGTQYENLVPLLQRNWGTVVTIADYDSSWDAYEAIKGHATGVINQVLDISLVNRPSFLSECVGQIAKEVRPLLVASAEHSYRAMSY